jgi:Rrf2 family transcriptional regulator, iron-sulfur cluster assembly transcription factor
VTGVTRQTDYALRVVLHLAAIGPRAKVQIREIAERRLLPPTFVRRVVARLSATGILRTTRGSGGGVALARPAGEISLMDVVRAMEGGIVLNRCVRVPRSCPLVDACPVQRAWTGATLAIEEYLGAITFADLSDLKERAISRQGYPGTTAPKNPRRTTGRSRD